MVDTHKVRALRLRSVATVSWGGHGVEPAFGGSDLRSSFMLWKKYLWVEVHYTI